MKTYNVFFKTNCPTGNDGFFAKAYASSIKEIKKEISSSQSPFYGYHLSYVDLSSVDYSINTFRPVPGFEQPVSSREV